MFKTNFIAGMSLVALLTVTMFAADAEAAGRAGRREFRQQGRIGQGLQSGQLNGREAARLERGERRIHRDVRQAKSDGEVTPREKARIERQQDRESKRIFRQKHDGQTQGNPGSPTPTPSSLPPVTPSIAQ